MNVANVNELTDRCEVCSFRFARCRHCLVNVVNVNVRATLLGLCTVVGLIVFNVIVTLLKEVIAKSVVTNNKTRKCGTCDAL